MSSGFYCWWWPNTRFFYVFMGHKSNWNNPKIGSRMLRFELFKRYVLSAFEPLIYCRWHSIKCERKEIHADHETNEVKTRLTKKCESCTKSSQSILCVCVCNEVKWAADCDWVRSGRVGISLICIQFSFCYCFVYPVDLSDASPLAIKRRFPFSSIRLKC